MVMPMPYFDHNATAPLHPFARDAWLDAYETGWQNPGGPYRSGARVHVRLDDARERLADILGGHPDRIVFTSGATESNNAVIASMATGATPDDVISVSPTEHPSVVEAAVRCWADRVVKLRVDRFGRIDEEYLAEVLASRRPRLVCIMAANNETGVLAPIKRLVDLCHEAGSPMLCDATQWIGKLSTDSLSGVDFLTGCGHKFGAPKGVGFIRIPSDGAAFSWVQGGDQEKGHRAGTENYPSVEAMVSLLAHLADTSLQFSEDREEMKREFEGQLVSMLPGTQVVGLGSKRLWNTVSVIMHSGENMRWVRKLDCLGYDISTGSACATGSDAPSHVLAAMGLSATEARRTIRISSGWETGKTGWKGLLEGMLKVSTDQASGPIVSVVNPGGRDR